MRILVVNVNTNQSMTEGIVRSAQRAASPNTEVVGLTPRFGAESCEGNFESYLAAVGVIDAVMSFNGEFDAVVQAGYGEHGREGLQELLDVPVVDITEAGAAAAMFLGRRYSVVTSLDRTVPLIEDRLLLAGLDRHCVSIRASGLSVLELESDSSRAVEAITGEASLAVKNEFAEVIVLGCGGMAGITENIERSLEVPVVDGVAAAIKFAESFCDLGLGTSKSRTYASPRSKRIVGWPLRGNIQSGA